MAYNPAPKYAVSKPATKKIQPKKNTGSVSEHGLGQINPVKPPLPHTVEKATKQIAAGLAAAKGAAAQARAAASQTVTSSSGGAPPPPQAPDPGQPQGGDDFASFLAQFFQPTAPPDINALIKSYLDPLKEMYGQQNDQITQQSQQQLGFDNTLAMQLGDYLKGIGGSDYTPTMAAALGLEAQRNDRYATSQAQSKLWDTIYGSSKSDIQKLIQGANDAYASSQPSGSDKLAAFNAYNGFNEQQYQHGRDAIGDQRLATNDANALAIKQEGLRLLGQKQGLAARNQSFQQWATSQRVYSQIASSTGVDPRTGKVTPKFQAQVDAMDATQRQQAIQNARADARLSLSQQQAAFRQSQAIAKQKAGNGPKVATTSDKTRWTKQAQEWYSGKPTSVRIPAKDKDGQPVYNKDGSQKFVAGPTSTAGTLNYQQAFRRLRAEGANLVTAQGILHSLWKRGERNRPWLTNQEKAALVGSHLTPTVGRYDKYRFLTDRQAAALRKAGKLPPGQAMTLRNRPVWVIDAGYE